MSDDETAAAWLVKWPRGADAWVDRLVLRTEHQYARALHDLGFDTCRSELHALPESKPSLWLQRFDRVATDTGLQRVAVESLYSLAGVETTGAFVSHQEFLSALKVALEQRDQLEDLPELVREYVRRDLIDLLLGNSDNHGRNRAVIRGARLTWAPIYDLAPMVMDPAGITRSTTWERHEYGGRIDWAGVCRELDDWLPGLEMEETLHEFSEAILELPEILRAQGVADEVLQHPRIYVGRLAETLERWGLR